MSKNKKPDQVIENNRVRISCEVVAKNFVGKNGKLTDRKEYYLRRSIQDYFIKFCESEISQKDIETKLDLMKDDLIKVMTFDVEFKEGLWDNCDENIEVQSRVGEYVVIYK